MIRKILMAAALSVSAVPAVAQQQATQGTAAVLRGLDKVNGRVTDVEVPLGGSANLLGVLVTVRDCRYPADNPTGNAFAYLDIRSVQNGVRYFEGWMVAASPALNALDHNRYDVWVLRCKTS